MLDQTSFIREIKTIEISRDRTKMKLDDLNDSELRLYRTMIGQLSWAANQTHPDILFDICEPSNTVKHAIESHIEP